MGALAIALGLLVAGLVLPAPRRRLRRAPGLGDARLRRAREL